MIVVAFLDLTRLDDVVMHRWQRGWENGVTFESYSWKFQRFEWSAIASGGATGGRQVELVFSGLQTVRSVLLEGAQEGWRGRLRVYAFPDEDDGSSPPGSMELLAAMEGALGVSTITLDNINAVLDSAVMADQGSFPPRRADSITIGLPCEL